MNNPKSLVSLAYIRTADNPYGVFCDYIEYCLTTAKEKQLRNDELKKKICENFAIDLPYRVICICINTLKKSNKIKMLDNGAGYILTSSTFNVDSFNLRRSDLETKEDKLLNSLCEYVKNYKQSWDIEMARNYLTKCLIDTDSGINVFLSEYEHKEENKLSPEWYVGKFITYLLENNSNESQYLIDVVNGLMIYLGIYQFDDYRQQYNQKFENTEFYIDTKLLLRTLGYSWDLEVEAANDLINLLQNDYSGKICVFEHTISEVTWALGFARDELKRKTNISDRELNVFARLKNFDSEDFDIACSSIRNAILDRNFKIADEIKWSESGVQKFNLDVSELTEFIKNKNSTWKSRAIENDVETVNRINILRRGNYLISFGGKYKLPIFVTTNSKLIRDIREYAQTKGQNDIEVAKWCDNKLPIISDYMLMCRLWLPQKSLNTSIPVLRLAREAYAVQQLSNIGFINTLKENAAKVKEKHKIEVVDVPDVRFRKLEEIIVSKSKGNMNDIDEDLVASSFEEVIALQTIAQEEKIKELENERIISSKVIDERNKMLTNSTAKRFTNKLGFKRLLLIFCEFWWLSLAIIGIIVSAVISYYSGLFPGILGVIVSILASILCFIIEKVSDSDKIKKILCEKTVPIVFKSYRKKISNGLEIGEKEFECDIIKKCVLETKALNKYIEHIDFFEKNSRNEA